MTRVFSLIVYLLIALLALMFALLNSHSARFNYYFGQIELPMSLLLALAVVVGAALGVTASLGLVIRAKRQASYQRRQAAKAENELNQLRALIHQDKQ